MGRWELKECPNGYCRDLVPLIQAADFMSKNIPPIAGGLLDQSASFVNFVERLESEENAIKAELHGQ